MTADGTDRSDLAAGLTAAAGCGLTVAALGHRRSRRCSGRSPSRRSCSAISTRPISRPATGSGAKARSRPGKPPNRRRVGFVNIPILAWLFVPLALLGELTAGWAVSRARRCRRRPRPMSCCCGSATSTSPTAAMLALSFLANGPLVNSLREGNTTHFILLLLVVALLLWRAGAEYRRRPGARALRAVQAAADAVRPLFPAARTMAHRRRRRDDDRRGRAAVARGVRARDQHRLVPELRRAVHRRRDAGLQRAVDRRLPRPARNRPRRC